ncbi:hypothetical protein ABH931_002977 [Streptacidiphilus sp. MAP12-33]|uniref:hypothetical protein n=1 Tax=Streptacidiphilus sp. MAP12-33 TaxID=3156266 RepID=UPI003512C1B4
MGARAQYVVVRDGAWQRSYSHRAANRVAEDLLPGPAPGPEGTTVAVNPAAHAPHEPARPAPDELAALRAALDALIAEAGTAP